MRLRLKKAILLRFLGPVFLVIIYIYIFYIYKKKTNKSVGNVNGGLFKSTLLYLYYKKYKNMSIFRKNLSFLSFVIIEVDTSDLKVGCAIGRLGFFDSKSSV